LKQETKLKEKEEMLRGVLDRHLYDRECRRDRQKYLDKEIDELDSIILGLTKQLDDVRKKLIEVQK